MAGQKESKPVSPNDQLIRIGHDTFRVDVQEYNDRPRLTKLSTDDLAEYAILCEIDKMYNTSMEKVINSVYEETTKDAKQNLQQILWKALGFNNGWGRWEIDHCNGRMSDLSNLMTERTKRFLIDEQLNLEAIFTDEALKQDLIKEVREYTKKKAKDIVQGWNFQRAIEEEIQKEMRSYVQKYVKENFSEIIVNKLNGVKFTSPKALVEDIEKKKSTSTIKP